MMDGLPSKRSDCSASLAKYNKDSREVVLPLIPSFSYR